MASGKKNLTEEREAKMLRSSEPDLKVILGTGDNESVLWYHSQTLASKSKYVDTMLSVPMKERDEYVISFPDISAETWEQMMKFIDDPVAARKMDERDALSLVEFYDKYEFGGGRNLCSYIISDYFSTRSLVRMEKEHKLDLDLIIDLVNVAHKANLGDALKQGLKYIWKKLQSFETRYGRLMFTESQLAKLVPVLKYSKANRKSLGLSIYGFDDLEADAFPKLFVRASQSWENESLLQRCISHIAVSGTSCNADGDYTSEEDWDHYTPEEERTTHWGGDEVTFRVEFWEPNDEDTYRGWTIVRKYPPTGFDEDGDPIGVVKKKCWIAQHSTNNCFPPRTGWISCDERARGEPKIKYVLNDEITR